MNQPATQFEYEVEVVQRSIGEQLAMNRSVVLAAEDKRLRAGLHPARWERRGPFGRLRPRPGLKEVA
jgi:hypothetical protein